ncbi:Mss4-like protein [Mycena amicta]|nr:Mss4-like protein [Mycena amicta]
MTATSKPASVTGGCLCGGVRYRVEFSETHDFERASHTCQCTQCRKWSGCLVVNFHTVTRSELHWLEKSTYAEYNSSAHFLRAFCSNCGSTLGWIDSDNEIELTTGSFDEEFLLGGRDEQDAAQGAFAAALASPQGDHFHVRNEIKGITDTLSADGRRFWKGSNDGPLVQ